MPRLPYEKALKLAQRVVEELSPYAARVEIAGSLRRERPDAGDIDLIVLPKYHRGLELLNKGVMSLVTGYETVSHGRILTNGNQSKRLLLRGSQFQCDLWIADYGKPAEDDLLRPTPAIPGNWGALMLTYTGSMAHNIHVVKVAQARGWKWTPTRGLVIPGPSAEVAPTVVSLDEQEIFQRLFGRWIEPKNREA